MFYSNRLKAEADPAAMAEAGHEDDRLGPLLRAAMQCLTWEHDFPKDVDAAVDDQFTGGATTRPLHARLRLIFHAEKGREEHYYLEGVASPAPQGLPEPAQRRDGRSRH